MVGAWAHNGDGTGKRFHSVSTLQCNMYVLLILLFLILVQVCSDCCNHLYTPVICPLLNRYPAHLVIEFAMKINFVPFHLQHVMILLVSICALIL